MSGVNPHEVALALKIAYLRGSWDAVSAIIETIEHEFGEVPLSELANYQRSMEAADVPKQECEELFVVVDWISPAEA
jgi:hypothetical protein